MLRARASRRQVACLRHRDNDQRQDQCGNNHSPVRGDGESGLVVAPNHGIQLSRNSLEAAIVLRATRYGPNVERIGSDPLYRTRGKIR